MLKTDQEKAAHAELIQRVANLNSLYDVAQVTAAVDALQRSYALITPAEAFLADVLMNYAWGFGAREK